jgi:hypothetical protein
MKDPNYAPTYMALYPELATIARKHGYALSIHGTLARDMDLVCIPWTKQPSKPDAVIDEITSTFHIVKVGKLERHEHNRLVQTISIGHGECFIDLSFMPRVGYGDEEDLNKRTEMEIWNLIDYCATHPNECNTVDQRVWDRLLIYIPKKRLCQALKDKETNETIRVSS